MLNGLKKLVALLYIVSSISLLSAISPESMTFQAFYLPTNVNEEAFISVDVLEPDSNGQFVQKVYQAGTIEHIQPSVNAQGQNIEGTSNAKTVFWISIKGNFTGTISIHLTTGPLQAHVGDMYYIPEHRFSIYTRDLTKNKDTMLFRIAEFKGPATGEYIYPNGPNRYNNNPVKSDNKSGNNKIRNIAVTSSGGSDVWELVYPVYVTIINSGNSAGEFDYYSNITLEVDAEKSTT